MKKFLLGTTVPLLFLLQAAAIAQTTAPSLKLNITTGGDDLREGSVAYAQIRLQDGRTLPKINLNHGRKWGNYSKKSVILPLPKGTSVDSLSSLTLIHDGAPRRFPDGYDNWNINAVSVFTPKVCTRAVTLASVAKHPWSRFTGSKTFASLPLRINSALSRSTPAALYLNLKTGTDDLRTGSVAFAEIRLRNGRTLPKVNLNRGRNWANKSRHVRALPLPRGTQLGQLASLTIFHDGAPRRFPDGYDNWNVDNISVSTPKTCSGGVSLASIRKRPWVRFTGGKTFATIPLRR